MIPNCKLFCFSARQIAVKEFRRDEFSALPVKTILLKKSTIVFAMKANGITIPETAKARKNVLANGSQDHGVK